MNEILKRVAAKLPTAVQQQLKRRHFRRQIRSGTFVGGEYEFDVLERWVGKGDWAIDVGANVGHYTKKLSDLVGEEGHVLAFEPVPETFELLTANTLQFRHRNVTPLNLAASGKTALVKMELPRLETGLDNYYQAQITEGGNSGFAVLAIAIDSLELPQPVKLVKIDAEGHEYQVLQGLKQLLTRDGPTLIVEGGDREVELFLKGLGYGYTYQQGSPNRVYSRQ